ncbi:hypothetical protein R7E49_24195, partial [Vibrio sp. Vb2110]|uniref:hypothetical protein n=1 Tax=unclassified Vibrio TaxID=2614977 RepID=UPI002964BAC0
YCVAHPLTGRYVNGGVMEHDFEGLYFGDWKPWSSLSNSWKHQDIPQQFGIYGVYLLATFDSEEKVKPFSPENMPSDIIYIGMSSHIDRRLSSSHKAIKRYRKISGDRALEKLWVIKADSKWNNSRDKIEGQAYVAYWERLLLLNYVRAYKTFPLLNSQ